MRWRCVVVRRVRRIGFLRSERQGGRVGACVTAKCPLESLCFSLAARAQLGQGVAHVRRGSPRDGLPKLIRLQANFRNLRRGPFLPILPRLLRRCRPTSPAPISNARAANTNYRSRRRPEFASSNNMGAPEVRTYLLAIAIFVNERSKVNAALQLSRRLDVQYEDGVRSQATKSRAKRWRANGQGGTFEYQAQFRSARTVFRWLCVAFGTTRKIAAIGAWPKTRTGTAQGCR